MISLTCWPKAIFIISFYSVFLGSFCSKAQHVDFGFVDTTISGVTEILRPSADATTLSAFPTRNLGLDSVLTVIGDTLNEAQSFFRFNLNQLPDSIEVVEARLVMIPSNRIPLNSVEDYILLEVKPFVENQITWATRPIPVEEQFMVGPYGVRVETEIDPSEPVPQEVPFIEIEFNEFPELSISEIIDDIRNGDLDYPFEVIDYILNVLVFDVTQNVQNSIVKGRDEINFRLQDFNDQSSEIIEFLSNENTRPIDGIYLLLRTRKVFRIDNADITHSLGVGLSDGSILPYVVGGFLPYSYNWYDASGNYFSSNRQLKNLEPGWYGLKVSDAIGQEIQMAFVVGIKCEKFDLEFTTNQGYIKDANVSNYLGESTSNFGLSGRFQSYGEKKPGLVVLDERTDYRRIIYPVLGPLQASFHYGRWETVSGLLDFQLWLDDAFIVDKADLTLYGERHLQPNRTTRFRSIQDPWSESLVNYNNRPRYGAPEKDLGQFNSPIAPDLVLDMKDYWNLWKSNNELNHGIYFDFYDFESITPSALSIMERTFYSTDHNNAMKWPKMSFELRLDDQTGCFNDVDQVPFAELKDNLDGGFMYTVQGKIKFVYDSEYELSPNTFIKYEIRTIQNQLIAGSDAAGNIQGGAQAISANIDDNRYTMDLNGIGLIPGQYYVIALFSIKGDQKVLKVLYR